MFIGNKIKELRKAQRLTLVQLAEKSKVQIATLSRIENQKMVGSLESHMAVAKALGVDITQLYGDMAEERNKLELKQSSARDDVIVHNEKCSYEILANKVSSKKMMPVLLRIEAGGKTKKEKDLIGTERFIYILEGKVEASIGDKKYTMAKNHSLYFDSSTEHYLTNIGQTPVKAISVVTPVSV